SQQRSLFPDSSTRNTLSKGHPSHRRSVLHILRLVLGTRLTHFAGTPLPAEPAVLGFGGGPGLYIVFLVLGGVSAGDIPATHAAHLHGLTLPHIHTQLFVQLVSQFHIFLLVPSIPLGRIVAGFTSLDADEFASGL